MASHLRARSDTPPSLTTAAPCDRPARVASLGWRGHAGCLAILGACLALPVALPAADADASSASKLVTLNIPLPASGDAVEITDLPASVSHLVADGWSVAQMQVVGKSADGKQLTVLLLLEPTPPPSLAWRGGPSAGGMPHLHLLPPGFPPRADLPGAAEPNRPGAAVPVAPAPAQTLVVRWQGGESTSIRIGDAVGVRAAAHITTSDADGTVIAEYDAYAFKTRQGDIEVDGRGAPLSKGGDSYSPDSFRIHADGSVEIMDDGGTRDAGHLAGAHLPGDANQDHAHQPDADQAPHLQPSSPHQRQL